MVLEGGPGWQSWSIRTVPLGNELRFVAFFCVFGCCVQSDNELLSLWVKTIKDIFVFRFSRFRIIVFLLLLLLLLVLVWRATRPKSPPPHLCNGIGSLIEMFHSIPFRRFPRGMGKRMLMFRFRAISFPFGCVLCCCYYSRCFG